MLVDNPYHNPDGDFYWNDRKLTYSGIGLYHPDLFVDCHAGAFPLARLLNQHLDKISFEHYRGEWRNVDTLERLQAIED